MGNIRPKKSLGQNFLTDRNIAGKIVDALGAAPQSVIVEIGPGTGALTGLLASAGAKVYAIEIDKDAFGELASKYPQDKFGNLELINADFMNFKLSDIYKIHEKKLLIIGNIPYNLSAPIFFKLFENAGMISRAVLMIQKEVAQRFTAPAKTKQYGILTLAAGIAGITKKEFDVSPNCFFPKPKVTSTVISIDFHDEFDNESFRDIMAVVKSAFNQRRKKLRNALRNLIETKLKINIDEFIKLTDSDVSVLFGKRAEELTLDDYKKLTNEIKAF